MPKKPPSALGVAQEEPDPKSNVLAFEKKAEYSHDGGDDTMEDIPNIWIVYTPGLLHKVMEYPALTEEEILEIRQITEADIIIRQVYMEDMVNIEI